MSVRFGVRAVKITVSATPVTLASQLGGTPFARNVYFRSDASAGGILIGGADVGTNTGYLMANGTQVTLSQVFPGSSGDEFDLTKIYVVGTTTNQIVYVMVDVGVTVSD